MMNILIVEDEQTNVKLLKFYIESFFTLKEDEKFNIDVGNNGLEAIALCLLNKYDIMFLDVKMPKCDGIKVLNTFKSNKSLNKPFISMVTAMGEDKYKNLFKLLKANSYIIKPFDKNKVHEVVEKVYTKKIDSIKKDEDIIYDDFEEFYTVEDSNDFYNKTDRATHIKVSAKEFLKEYDNLQYMLEDIEDINDMLNEIILNLDFSYFKKCQINIEITLMKYITFLNSLGSFHKFASALTILNNHIKSIDIDEYDNLKASFIIEIIRAILEDISLWKDNVFVNQDTNDVYYINASVLSNCRQLENVLCN